MLGGEERERGESWRRMGGGGKERSVRRKARMGGGGCGRVRGRMGEKKKRSEIEDWERGERERGWRSRISKTWWVGGRRKRDRE